MRLILKLIATPLVVLLTVLVAVLLFLFSLSCFLITASSVIVGLMSVGLFFLGYPVGAVAYLVIAFLLSPLVLQAAEDFFVGKMDNFNLSLRQFITS